jgi:N-hydroxyarylamine O-acetyltransferase
VIDVDGYLSRIGATRPAAPTIDGLRDLQRRHLAAVPFENLSVHLREPIRLESEALVDKVVRRSRGGICYELNGAFAALLTTLGYRVELLSAQVFGADGEPGPPADHLALRVELAEPWLVDVGFGRFSRFPVSLTERGPQHDPDGEFTIVDGDLGALDVWSDGKAQYRLEPTPRRLSDFGPMCWYHQTSPDSPFTRKVTCSLPTPTGRVTLSDNKLIRIDGDHRVERDLTDAEALATYRDVFGIMLDRLPPRESPPPQ